MKFSCFRPVSRDVDADQEEAPRMPRKKTVNRQGSNQSQASRCSTVSNSSISKLPPCKRESDCRIDAMMMPVPPEPRVSRCLRMSHPKIYSGIVDSMKETKGCRDWRKFDVFYTDEVDMTISAPEVGQKRAADHDQKLRDLNSFSSDVGQHVIGVDMIG